MRDKDERGGEVVIKAASCLIGAVLVLLSAYQLADVWGAVLVLGAMLFLFGLLVFP
jgi:hypothetical protein